MDISFDKKTFKALSSDARIDILKLLAKRNYLQTEISQELNLKAPTVKEHMDALIDAGLVNRLEEGRKWKYLELTKKAKAIFYPEQTKITFLLSTLVFSVAGGVYYFANNLFAQTTFTAAKSQAVIAAAPVAEDMMLKAMPTATAGAKYSDFVASQFPWGLFAYISLLVILMVLLIYYTHRNKRYRRANGQ